MTTTHLPPVDPGLGAEGPETAATTQPTTTWRESDATAVDSLTLFSVLFVAGAVLLATGLTVLLVRWVRRRRGGADGAE